MSVSLERAEKALRYLAETDQEIAEARADVSRAEYILKRREATSYLSASGTQEERRSIARASDDYEQASETYTKALAAYEYLKAKRETERIVWETWRSLESSRRQGA